MPIFISYNNADKLFAETLAMNLVQNKHRVWIDKWELSAGDSLIDRIEEAVEGADAILVLLSNNSIESAWCRKELKSGLIRELEERQVIVIPILLDDCEVPLFLRDKLYVDLRKGDNDQFRLLLDSLDKISNPTQSRSTGPRTHTDWAVSSFSLGPNIGVQWTFLEHGETLEYSIFCQVDFLPETNFQKSFRALPDDQARYEFASQLMREFLQDSDDLTVRITSSAPEIFTKRLSGNSADEAVQLRILTQRLGTDIGFDTLVHIGNYFQNAVNHTLSSMRQGTEDRDKRDP